MVKIIDGEIVQDDDPRVKSPGPNRPRHDGGAVAAPPAQGGGASLFDWSAPPIRVVPEAPGEGILAGVPGLAVFGAHIRSTHLVMLVGAGLLLGLKGLLVGAILWFIYASNQVGQQGAAAQQQNQQQQQRVAAGSNYFSNLMNSAPLGRGEDRHGGGRGAGGPGTNSNAGHGQDGSWQGKGKAYKLSG